MSYGIMYAMVGRCPECVLAEAPTNPSRPPPLYDHVAWSFLGASVGTRGADRSKPVYGGA